MTTYTYKPYKGFILSQIAAQQMLGKAVNNCKIGIVGQTGEGKSEMALYLAYATACECSLIKYGDEDHWYEFYPYDQNTAIISMEDMMRVSTTSAPYTVKVFDEIQEEGNNSRDFRTNLNRLFNQLFVLKRPERNTIITDAQWVSMVDRQSRYLYHYYCEMSPIHDFEHGIGMCKVKKVSLRGLEEKDPAHYTYPYEHGIQYQLCASLLAPPEIRHYYKEHRKEQEKVSEERRMERERRSAEIEDAKYNRAMKGSKTEQMVAQYLSDDRNMTSVQLAELTGLSQSTIRSTSAWRKKGN